ncbi:MAG: hypothetical protein KF712_16405 [Akkermansiaceae bacterium]|nr:hypothetical protein [Akkermansiaceae bacterium]
MLFLQKAKAFILLPAYAFLFLLADLLLLLAKLFFAFPAHLLRVVDPVQMRFVRIVGI